MLTQSATIFENPEQLGDYFHRLLEQYPAYKGYIRRLRQEKRRSEYLHGVLNLDSSSLDVRRCQLSKIPDRYASSGTSATVLKTALLAAEAAGTQPLLVEILHGSRVRVAILGIGSKGDLQAPARREVLVRLKTAPRRSSEDLALDDMRELFKIFSRRLVALEELLRSHNIALPDGYDGLIDASKRWLGREPEGGVPHAG